MFELRIFFAVGFYMLQGHGRWECFDMRTFQLYEEYNWQGKNELIHAIHMKIFAVDFDMVQVHERQECFGIRIH